MSTQTLTAIQTWGFIAFGEVPETCLMYRRCLLQQESRARQDRLPQLARMVERSDINSSICKRFI